MPANYHRRSLVVTFALYPLGLMLGRLPVRRTAGVGLPASPGDDQAYIERLVGMRGAVSIPARATPYRLRRPITVGPDTRVSLAEGVGFVYDPGATPISPTDPVGVFELAGDRIRIEGVTEVRVRSSRPDPNLYAVLARGVRDAVITNIMAEDCAHAYITAATEAYAQIATSGPEANASARVTIAGGGAVFAHSIEGAGHAACVIAYCRSFEIRDCRYRNVAHGVQWWGGDADPDKDGRLDNPRKCGPGQIARVDVAGSRGASVWGSMGRDILVSDCIGRDAGDVGFDCEGGVGITFLRCSQTNAKAGCFTVFFENDAVRFVDCTAVQPRADQPIFRTYGKGGENRAIVIERGHFSCSDGAGPGTVDNAYGAIDDLLVRGATFNNVILRLDYRPFRRIVITGNRFSYRMATTMPVVSVGAAAAGASRPSLTVRHNAVLSPQGAGPEMVRFVGGGQQQLNSNIADNHILRIP